MTARGWLPLVVAGFEIVMLLLVMLVVGSTAVVSSDSVSTTTASGRTVTTTHSSFDGSVSGAIGALFASIPFWLVIIVLVGITSLWTAREKALLIALPFAAAIAFGALPMLGYALGGSPARTWRRGPRSL